jgi:hypothetical protein
MFQYLSFSEKQKNKTKIPSFFLGWSQKGKLA